MPFTLQVISYKGLPPHQDFTFIIDRSGAIGRSSENEFVLPDPERFVSRKHGVFRIEGGNLRYTDTSAAGTYLGNRKHLLHQDTVTLNDGDRLKIGDFELLVNASPAETGAEGTSPPEPRGGQPSRPTLEVPAHIPGQREEGFVTRGASPVASAKEVPAADTDQDTPTERTNFVPPEIPLSGVSHPEVPERPTAIGPQSRGPDRRKSFARAEAGRPAGGLPPGSNLELISYFLEGAGLGGLRIVDEERIPEMMRTLGVLFHDLIEGMIMVLRARAEEKRELRVTMTTMRAGNNNPLKSTPSAEYAMRIMLGSQHPGFLEPSEAVREAFQDLMSHQLATTAAIQASLAEQMKRFDPKKFEKRYKEGLVFQKKAKCWDDYCAAYTTLVSEASEDIFGDEFREVYEEQLRMLHSSPGLGD